MRFELLKVEVFLKIRFHSHSINLCDKGSYSPYRFSLSEYFMGLFVDKISSLSITKKQSKLMIRTKICE